jgi:hypothetical protein
MSTNNVGTPMRKECLCCIQKTGRLALARNTHSAKACIEKGYGKKEGTPTQGYNTARGSINE